jgi:hypothetical protein
LFPLVEYAVNYDYISKTLCVNKEKPIMACDGKCYLMSELTKSFDAEKPISDKKDNIKSIEISFFQDFKKFDFNLTFVKKKLLFNHFYSNNYCFLNSNTIFHPPLV